MNIAVNIPNGRTLADRLASKELASAMSKRAKMIALPTDGILFRQGDEPEAVLYLGSGEVMLTMDVGEKTIMAVRVPAGSLLGLPAVMGNKPYSLTATAVGEVEVFRLSCDEFRQMIVQEGLCFDVVRILVGEIHSARVALGECLNRAV